jgi:glycosyltransferase involved in cell wall biosynthesis
VRVTYLNKYYFPHLGGIEYHLHDLATAMAATGDVEARAIVANEGPYTVREDVDGVEVKRVARTAAVSSTPVALGMRRAIQEEAEREDGPDLFHLHFPYPWGEAMWLAAGTDVPSVLTYHSDIVRQKAGLAAYRPMLERVLDAVDLIVAGSPNMVEASEFLAPRADKCRVVPYGIHVERFDATPEMLARAADFRSAHRRPIVLFVGRLVYYKGAEVLIRALPDVDADVVLIGEGPLELELRELGRELGVADRLTFLAPMDDFDLAAWYHAADVFCLPSVARSEAFGLVQIEAHAAGTPVVSTRLTTGVPFANLDGVTGLTVEPEDVGALAAALRRILDDDELRSRLAVQARERARNDFTTERMVADMLEVYREAIETRTAG